MASIDQRSGLEADGVVDRERGRGQADQEQSGEGGFHGFYRP